MAQSALRALGRDQEIAPLVGPSTRSVEAWFLGPKGENADELERLVVEALRDQVFWRRSFHPGDPTHITEAIKATPDYLQALGALKEGFRELLAFLKKSVPFFSMRYQGHMNWEVTLPGLLGYFAAMLYNPNNVAFEGATATTILELLVGDDLCRMLGYDVPATKDVRPGAIRPWGHITCDGTVANIEAIWSARNLKLYPLAVREAIAEDAALAPARKLEISLPTGASAQLVDLGAWQLLNLDADRVLELPTRLANDFGISRQLLTASVGRYSAQNLGLGPFARKFLSGIPGAPAVFVPGSKHYSFPKAAALLGLGADNLIDVAVDLDARMDIDDLRRRLDRCRDERRPVIAVVAVIGSTEESAVDPLASVLELRDQYARQGFVFHVHADAAWGGYHRSVINDDFALPAPAFGAPPIVAPLSDYVVRQFQSLGRADSITVDPHKSGYIPYPAGALCYRNGAMRDLVTFSAPVVFHGDAEPTVGIYGIEGSKPGAAAAAVYLSHRVIRPSHSGYGKIIGEALFSCRKLYARLLSMAGPTDPFIVVPVPRLPSERRGEDPTAERARIRELIDHKSSDEIRGNRAALALLREIGPDENILSYAFNFRRPDGTVNADLKQANDFNTAIYRRLSIRPGEDVYGRDMVVSTTDLSADTYGSAFIENYKHRLGTASSPGGTVTVLRSVVMDPWVTETASGSFIDVLERALRGAVLAESARLQCNKARGY